MNGYTNTSYRPRRKKRRHIFRLLLVLVVILAAIVHLRSSSDRGFTGGLAACNTRSFFASDTLVTDFDLDYGKLEDALAERGEISSPSQDELSALYGVAGQYPQYREETEFFAEHAAYYSQDAINTVIMAPEKAAFVLLEPFAELQNKDIKLKAKKGEVPFLLQYDSRWAFYPYGSSVMGYTACGPTCLSMAAIGLTGDGTLTPVYISEFAEREGYYVSGVGTAWSIFTEGAAQLGLRGEVISADESTMKSRLDSGEVLILSMTSGDFTKNGHFIVVHGYDSEGFQVYDPSCVERSNVSWSFDRLYYQIAQVWSFSLA